jgi:hypothetical protein
MTQSYTRYRHDDTFLQEHCDSGNAGTGRDVHHPTRRNNLDNWLQISVSSDTFEKRGQSRQ